MSRKNGDIEEREDRIKVKRVEGKEKRRCERRWVSSEGEMSAGEDWREKVKRREQRDEMEMGRR